MGCRNLSGGGCRGVFRVKRVWRGWGEAVWKDSGLEQNPHKGASFQKRTFIFFPEICFGIRRTHRRYCAALREENVGRCIRRMGQTVNGKQFWFYPRKSWHTGFYPRIHCKNKFSGGIPWKIISRSEQSILPTILLTTMPLYDRLQNSLASASQPYIRMLRNACLRLILH